MKIESQNRITLQRSLQELSVADWPRTCFVPFLSSVHILYKYVRHLKHRWLDKVPEGAKSSLRQPSAGIPAERHK